MRTLFFLFFLPSLFAPILGFAKTEAEILQKAAELKWHESKVWRRLLQFDEKTNESSLDGMAFFLDPKGKTDPSAELQASLKLLISQKTQDEEPRLFQCRYPARADFLRASLKSIGIETPTLGCPRFQTWYETVRGESISVVFSSYYLNNPSSAFGHTFVRVNKVASNAKRDHFELLDYGFNFAANAADDMALVYTYKGLFGGYPGTFTTTPYYYKVREYSHAESRDLWDYELDLPKEGVERIVKHIWEVGPTYADYWYLTENCSYFILKLIEVGDPEKELVSKVKKFVVPKETVVVLFDDPKFVKTIRYRPSTRSVLLERMKLLSTKEQRLLGKVIRDQKWNLQLDVEEPEQRAHILDAALDYMDFFYAIDVQRPDSEASKFKTTLLKKRSAVPVISNPVKVAIPESEAPHLGHGVRRMGAGLVGGRGDTRGLLAYKFSLHDLLEPDAGYPPNAQITFFNFVLDYNQERMNLRELTFFEVQSQSVITSISRSPSWGLQVMTGMLERENCERCYATGAEGFFGWTAGLSDSPLLTFSAGLMATAQAISQKGKAHAEMLWSFAGAGPRATLRLKAGDDIFVMASSSSYFDTTSFRQYVTSHQIGAQYSWNMNQGLRLTGTEKNRERSLGCELYFYY